MKKKLLILLCVILLTMSVSCTYESPERSSPMDDMVASDLPMMTEETPEPEEEETPVAYEGIFELPLVGSTGYTSTDMNIRAEANASSNVVATFPAGTPFVIVEDADVWWLVEAEGVRGYLESGYCLVNLPDIIPSIVYDDTNAYASLMVSSSEIIPGITGEKLYDGKAFNQRLNKDEFIVLTLYPMAKKIASAQKVARAEGNSLKIYEAYRPYETQQKIVTGLKELARTNSRVKQGIDSYPWSMDWFIATGYSNHQRGGAIDVSLVKIDTVEDRVSSGYSYESVVGYTEFEMPTKMHELSSAAAMYNPPVSSNSDTAWRSAQLSSTVNDSALILQRYLTGAGLTPLSSEWWHFNDLETLSQTSGRSCNGSFVASTCLSVEGF